MNERLEQNEPEGESSGPTLDGAGRKRRRLLTGGVSAALVMTVAGRPAWGSACTPSALGSANTSGRHDYTTCASKSAGYWRDTTRWPSNIDPDAAFHSYFSGSRYIFYENGQPVSLGLGEVINLAGNSSEFENQHQLGLHTVGALVNAHAFPVGSQSGDFGYTPQQIIDIYDSSDNIAETAAFFELINNQFDA